MTSVPSAMIFTRSVLEAEDLAEMLLAQCRITAEICRSYEAALSFAKNAGASVQLAFVTGSSSERDHVQLQNLLDAAGSKVVLIDGDPDEAQQRGHAALLRPFSGDDVQAVLGGWQPTQIG